MAMGAVPVHSPSISGPALATGAGKTVMLVTAVPVQPLLSVTVQLRSKIPAAGLLNDVAAVLADVRNAAPPPFHEYE